MGIRLLAPAMTVLQSPEFCSTLITLFLVLFVKMRGSTQFGPLNARECHWGVRDPI
jgi:hypothetical protein